MNTRQRRTLERIFERPVRNDVLFLEVARLVEALGATIHEGAGSRFLADKDGFALRLHRPHPNSELKPYAVRAVREWLEKIGAKP